MGRSHEAPGRHHKHHGGIVIICQSIQMQVRYDKDPVFGTCDRRIGGISALRENSNYFGLDDT